MRSYGSTFRWLLPFFLMLTTATHMAAQNGEGVRDAVSSLRPELLEDSKALSAVLNECKRHSGALNGHAVGDLQKHLGKEMTPRDPDDITTMLRIADDCTAYLSSPDLVSGMELPAAQEVRLEANNTLQKLDEISRKVAGNDLRSLEAQIREYLQSPTPPQSAAASVRQPSVSAASTSGNVQPLAVYQRASNAPDLPGRIAPERVQAIILEASQEAKSDTDNFLSEAASTVSADLLALQRATMRYPNFASHPLMQSITALKRQLGKSLQPKNVSDVETVTELLSRTLPIFGGSEFQLAYAHVDSERKAIEDYNVRESAISSAISSAANTIANIERTLDQGNLVAADNQYQQMASDRQITQLPAAQQYLQETEAFRHDLAAYVQATQVICQGNLSVTQEILCLAQENELFNSTQSSKPIARKLLQQAINTDAATTKQKLLNLPSLQIDGAAYKVPDGFVESSSSPLKDKVSFLAERLSDLDNKLDSVRELRNVAAQTNALDAVADVVGREETAGFKQKLDVVDAAVRLRALLIDAQTALQPQIDAAEAEAAEQQRKQELRDSLVRLNTEFATMKAQRSALDSKLVRALGSSDEAQGFATYRDHLEAMLDNRQQALALGETSAESEIHVLEGQIQKLR